MIQPAHISRKSPTSRYHFSLPFCESTRCCGLAKRRRLRLAQRSVIARHSPITWGSIQGADATLQTQRGNAIDTASLTIALLRASGIPARYQFGTVDIPADQAMNWAGGFKRPEALLNLLYQGGIAARALTSGGRISTIRMEHAWVKAYVNWSPGRGSRQGGEQVSPSALSSHGQVQHPSPNAQLNAWADIDTAYKQYTYSEGMNLRSAVPLDAQALITAAKQGATLNEAEGWVQNLNQANIQSQLTDYQAWIKRSLGLGYFAELGRGGIEGHGFRYLRYPTSPDMHTRSTSSP